MLSKQNASIPLILLKDLCINTIYFTPAVWEPVLCVQPSHPDRRLHRTQQGEQLEKKEKKIKETE